MLRIAKDLHSICFSDLMRIYVEANKENGEESYPTLSEQEQIYEAEQDFYQYLHQVFFHQDDAIYYIWEFENRYCSALRLEPYRDGLLLCGLETAPSDRRKGYAEKLIRAVQNHISSNAGGSIYSHVSKSNRASLLLHQKCGFEIIADYAVYSDGSVMQNSYTLIYTC